MNPARFAALLQAYGADPDRWPPAERADADAFLTQHPQADALRIREADLDRALSAWTIPDASAELQRKVLTRLAQARRAPPPLFGRIITWAGVGALGAVGAGAIAGAALVALLPPADRLHGATANVLYEQSSFGDVEGLGNETST